MALVEKSMAEVKPEKIRERFDKTYARLYGRTYAESPVEFINFKVRASLPERLLTLSRLERRASPSISEAVKGQRPAYSAKAKEFIPYTVYDRYRLFEGAKFRGPAIIEERESTVIVGEDAEVCVDGFGFLSIDML